MDEGAKKKENKVKHRWKMFSSLYCHASHSLAKSEPDFLQGVLFCYFFSLKCEHHNNNVNTPLPTFCVILLCPLLVQKAEPGNNTGKHPSALLARIRLTTCRGILVIMVMLQILLKIFENSDLCVLDEYLIWNHIH